MPVFKELMYKKNEIAVGLSVIISLATLAQVRERLCLGIISF
jgi:hypothetical protein